jgi:hypothetical protein
MPTRYAEDGALSYTLRDKKVAVAITDDTIAHTLGDALRGRAAKVVARAASTCESAVKKWRLGQAIPNGAALIRLMAADDEVFAAVLDLAGRSPAGLSAIQRQALADALRLLGD